MAERWEQRFENFEKQLNNLIKSFEQESFSDLELSGLVKKFELCFELSWKTMKDYLEYLGTEANSPRTIIKEAFVAKIISEGHLWIEMLEARNTLAHVYDEDLVLSEVIEIKQKFIPKFVELKNYLKAKND